MEILTEIFNRAMTKGKVPHDWIIGVLLPIYKKGTGKNVQTKARYRITRIDYNYL